VLVTAKTDKLPHITRRSSTRSARGHDVSTLVQTQPHEQAPPWHYRHGGASIDAPDLKTYQVLPAHLPPCLASTWSTEAKFVAIIGNPAAAGRLINISRDRPTDLRRGIGRRHRRAFAEQRADGGVARQNLGIIFQFNSYCRRSRSSRM
jgi:hypothetical protein